MCHNRHRQGFRTKVSTCQAIHGRSSISYDDFRSRFHLESEGVSDVPLPSLITPVREPFLCSNQQTLERTQTDPLARVCVCGGTGSLLFTFAFDGARRGANPQTIRQIIAGELLWLRRTADGPPRPRCDLVRCCSHLIPSRYVRSPSLQRVARPTRYLLFNSASVFFNIGFLPDSTRKRPEEILAACSYRKLQDSTIVRGVPVRRRAHRRRAR